MTVGCRIHEQIRWKPLCTEASFDVCAVRVEDENG